MSPLQLVLFCLVFLAGLGLDQPAYAYLDPGTGSMILQLLLGGIAGALVVGKLYWQKLKDLFRRGHSSQVSESETSIQEAQDSK